MNINLIWRVGNGLKKIPIGNCNFCFTSHINLFHKKRREAKQNGVILSWNSSSLLLLWYNYEEFLLWIPSLNNVCLAPDSRKTGKEEKQKLIREVLKLNSIRLVKDAFEIQLSQAKITFSSSLLLISFHHCFSLREHSCSRIRH